MLTLDRRDRIAEALLIEDGKVAAVGSNADAREWITAGTAVRDLDGLVVMPGFVDAHGHFPGGGLDAVAADLNGPPIGAVTTVSAALDRLSEFNRQRHSLTNAVNVEGTLGLGSAWLVGFGFDDTVVHERRHLTRDDLDQVSTDEGVAVLHISAHIVYVNSVALRELGITKDTPDPEGGHIGRDANGEPNGVLYENARHEALARAMDFSLRDQLKAVQRASAQAAAQGFTTVQNGLASETMASALTRASRLGAFPQRLVLWPDSDLGRDLAAGDKSSRDYTAEKVLLGPTKYVADGSIQLRTAFLREPYYRTGNYPEGWRGAATASRTDLADSFSTQFRAGRSVAVHCNGDASIDLALDALQDARRRVPTATQRAIVVHSQMATRDQLRRMRDLRATPTFFAAHVFYWGDRHRELFLGPDRASRISPMGWARDLDLRWSIHLDTPVVPLNSAMLLWSAVARRTCSGTPLGTRQRVRRVEALRGMTSEPAWQNDLADTIGSIEPGKHADLVVSAQNPLDPGTDLRKFHVYETWIGGQRVHASDRRTAVPITQGVTCAPTDTDSDEASAPPSMTRATGATSCCDTGAFELLNAVIR